MKNDGKFIFKNMEEFIESYVYPGYTDAGYSLCEFFKKILENDYTVLDSSDIFHDLYNMDEKYFKEERDSCLYNLVKGLYYSCKKKYDLAEKYLLLAKKYDDNRYIQKHLFLFYAYELNNIDEAMKHTQNYFMIGLYFHNKKNYEKAKEYFKRSGCGSSKYYLGIIYKAENNPIKAFSYFLESDHEDAKNQLELLYKENFEITLHYIMKINQLEKEMEKLKKENEEIRTALEYNADLGVKYFDLKKEFESKINENND